MNKKIINNVRLGLFVVIGIAFLIFALYMIGNNRNLFGSTFRISAVFLKVNGLVPGGNVRFSGIDVGTVKSVRISSDTSVEVTMIIESDARRFIRKTAVAAVGTDGLMGNTLVEIMNTKVPAEPVEDGDAIGTIRPVETTQMIRTLEKTNNDLAEIALGLKEVTRKVNNSRALWSILSDSGTAENTRQALIAIKVTTQNTAALTKDLRGLIQDARKGKGIINYMVYDTLAPGKLRKSLSQIDRASDTASLVIQSLNQFTEKIRRGESTAGILLTDTAFAHSLNESMQNIRTGSAKLNENMEAMKHSFLLRGYFRKQEKEERKAREEEERKKAKGN